MPPMLPFCTRYVISAMDLSKNCRDHLRIGIMEQSLTDDCLEVHWYDIEHFFKIRHPISEDYIDGFANLRYEHQMEILRKMGYDLDGASTSEQPPTKRCRLNNLELEKQIENQNEEFFAVYDKLKSFKVDSGHCRAILEANNQFVPECYEEILIHLSDVLYFGALAPCPVCKDGKLVFRNSVYCCTGFDSAWSSCTHTVREPQRIPVEIPEKYKEKLGTDFKVRTRVLRDVTEFNEDEFEMYTKQPLFGLDFCIVGETNMRREDIENKIEAMGGKITTKVHANLAAVISNAEEVENFSGLIREAFYHQIQVVSDSFLNEVMKNDPIDVIVKKDLSKWANDPYERIPKRQFPVWQMRDDRSAQDYYSNRIDKNERNVYNEAVLNFVDISLNKNTYFKLRLFDTSFVSTKYIVRESMGRIGTSIGTINDKSYATLELAQEEFNKIYFEKTGNHFDTSEFVKKPRLFNHIRIDNESLAEVKQKSQDNWPATKLSKPLFELMKLMCDDDEEVFKSTLIGYCFDLDIMPLGKLSKAQIQDALNTLGEISSVLNTGNRKQIIALSNQFYSYFPHNFGHHRPPIIATSEMVQEKMEMLQNLMQKQQRYEFLISESNQEKNLLDLCYARLEESAEITLLNKSSGMYTQICDYVKNTQLQFGNYSVGAFGVEEIFEVSCYEELIRYAPHESSVNRQLLFHGTPIKNVVSILTNGLKSSPQTFFDNPAIERCIYFADSLSKSIVYSHSERSGIKLILLCEVAVGMSDVRHPFNSKKSDRCETIQLLGEYQPEQFHIRSDGLKIPSGKLVRREEIAGMMFNEFIVPDESRVKIRYIVKLTFK